MTDGLREGKGLGAGGIQLHWRLWEAPEPLGSLLILHGLGEHSGRYDPIARFLAGRGFSVFSFDLRGHGVSHGPRGDIDAFPRYLEDLLAMEAEMERQLRGGGPRFLMGHSMGGLLALQRVQTLREPYMGVVLSAPWLATAVPEWVRRLGTALAWTVPWLPLPNGLSPERLTRDPEMIRARKEDPLNHTRITGRLYRGVHGAQKQVLGLGAPEDLPLLFLIPSADPVVRSSATESFAGGIVGTGIRVEILEGRRHEPLNDLGREDVFSILASWLQGQIETPGGSASIR
ncbi:alpha/beta hydrolase [Gemmatimonadota bacterium]